MVNTLRVLSVSVFLITASFLPSVTVFAQSDSSSADIKMEVISRASTSFFFDRESQSYFLFAGDQNLSELFSLLQLQISDLDDLFSGQSLAFWTENVIVSRDPNLKFTEITFKKDGITVKEIELPTLTKPLLVNKQAAHIEIKATIQLKRNSASLQKKVERKNKVKMTLVYA